MQKDEAVTLITQLIHSEAKHPDYDRTVTLADDYRIFITGEGIEKKLIQFVRREDVTMFAQRLRLTKSITPAIASSIRQPFNKVVRNDRIRKDIRLKKSNLFDVVTAMKKNYYGAPNSKDRGLEYWLKTRYQRLQFIDPNAWVVMEWKTPETQSQIINCHPFEVRAKEAVNFKVVNEVVKWLLVQQTIMYDVAKQSDAPSTIATNRETTKKEGCRYTLYDEDYTVVFEQADKDVYQLQGQEAWVEIKSRFYVARIFEPKIGYVPAFRIGYKTDEVTEGRTFVNPWHDALCYFEKSLKTVSELDLTMSLHTFPQKFQYIQACTGTPATAEHKGIACNSGYQQGAPGRPCGACKGTGYKVHTSAQDAVLLKLPTDPTNDDIVDLEKLAAYKSPPIDTVKFQNEYVLQLEKQAHQAVFNSQMFVKKSATNTATEVDFNMQAVYDALEPYTEKQSECWIWHVTTMAIIAGEAIENVDASYDYPADFKLKTSDVLLTELKSANESGAPAFLVDTINNDLADIIYAGDDLGKTKYYVKQKFYPFTGKTPDEVAMLLVSEFVPGESKILYSNFEQIFREIQNEHPEFWLMKSFDAQRVIVDAKVEEWKIRLDEAKPEPVLPNPFGTDSEQNNMAE